MADEQPTKTYDLCIIGGGINGAGICFDAALRGLSVLLVEKNDFGSFTTSASTKLIHGGLRYLEHFEFGLVRESLRERELLLKNAPHLVKPLQLKIPVYKKSRHSALKLRMGMLLYDLLSYDKTLPRHSFKKIKTEPEDISLGGLEYENLEAIISYFDCQIEYPERLCLELILSAKKLGAKVLNHHKFVENLSDVRNDHSLRLVNQLTNEEKIIRAKVIVNSGGAFVDEINQNLHNLSTQLIGGTKGSHILIEQFAGGPKTALYMEAKSDGRPLFIIPWRNYYLIGTTDIYANLADHIVASEIEIDYLIMEFNNFFPNRNLLKDDVVYTYSGIRPLLYEPEKKEGEVTRKHIIVDHAKDGLKNCFSIVGGKITTYRNLAEETVDKVCDCLNLHIPSSTKTKAVIGGNNFINNYNGADTVVKQFASQYQFDEDIVKHLILFYGSRFEEVLELTKGNINLKGRIDPQHPCIFAQVAYGILYEEAKTLDDIIFRRMILGTVGDLGYQAASKISNVAAKYLDWNNNKIEDEVSEYKKLVVEKFHSIYANQKKINTLIIMMDYR